MGPVMSQAQVSHGKCAIKPITWGWLTPVMSRLSHP
jgi:hypothetical protein